MLLNNRSLEEINADFVAFFPQNRGYPSLIFWQKAVLIRDFHTLLTYYQSMSSNGYDMHLEGACQALYGINIDYFKPVDFK